MIRPAREDDVGQLVEIEEACFRTDRITRERFRRLLRKGNAATLVRVAEDRRTITGYAMLLFRRGARAARLYSIAVRPAHRGRGIALELLRRCEQFAARHRCKSVRLEVAERNRAARRLYEREGYVRFGRVPDYYEDLQAALRYEKVLA